MTTPTGIARELAQLRHRLEGLTTYADQCWDKTAHYPHAEDDWNWIRWAADDLTQHLDQLQLHLAKIGVYTPTADQTGTSSEVED